MSWNQRNAHFICEVASARKNDETILSDKYNGIKITVAGEYGALCIRVWNSHDKASPSQGKDKRNDKFSIDFKPWRKSNTEGGVRLMEGRLNFDDHAAGGITMQMNDELLEALSLIRAKEIMVAGTAAEELTD